MLQKALVVVFLLAGCLAPGNGKSAEARNEDVPKGPAAPQTTTKPQSGQQPTTRSVSPAKGVDTKAPPTTGGADKGASPAK